MCNVLVVYPPAQTLKLLQDKKLYVFYLLCNIDILSPHKVL